MTCLNPLALSLGDAGLGEAIVVKHTSRAATFLAHN